MKTSNRINIKEFIANNREALQIIYGVVLIILIPLLIAYNTIFIINKYNASADVALQRQALIVGRSVYALLKDDLGKNEAIQKKVNEVFGKNSEIQELSVVEPEGDDFKVIASSQKSDVGKKVNFYYYKMAWLQPDNDGLATDSLKLAAVKGDEGFLKGFSAEDRFWLVSLPMSDALGKKQALLNIKISSKIIDDLTNDNRSASIYVLLITILIVVLFLAVTVRLWDYAILYRKIKEVDQMKDEFISIASHELRTPLTVTKGYLSMILEGTFGKIENPEIEKALNTAARSNGRLEGLVEDLLNVSRIEQGRFQMENKNIDLQPILQEIVSQLKVNADEKKLALEYLEPDKKLPLISADPERLKQVLLNLIGNAVKYTEKGSVKITTQVKDKMMEIKIVDTGIGMSPEEQKHLFEKFYRAQNEKTSKIIGTGLGLWITKQIVELMNGKIIFESMKDVGTHITLSLKLA